MTPNIDNPFYRADRDNAPVVIKDQSTPPTGEVVDDGTSPLPDVEPFGTTEAVADEAAGTEVAS